MKNDDLTTCDKLLVWKAGGSSWKNSEEASSRFSKWSFLQGSDFGDMKLIKEPIEYQKALVVNFVDFEKAFDSVNGSRTDNVNGSRMDSVNGSRTDIVQTDPERIVWEDPERIVWMNPERIVLMNPERIMRKYTERIKK